MLKQWTWGVIAGAGLFASPLVAVEAAARQTAHESDIGDDEVVVRGTALWALREDAIRAEDRFYARYNELNKVDDFDVECAWSEPTGSHVKRRGCLTKLAVRAQQGYSSDYLYFLQGTGPMPDRDPHIALLDRFGEFRDNVLYLLKTNPDLRRLVRERAQAVKRYNVERRKHFRGRIIEYR